MAAPGARMTSFQKKTKHKVFPIIGTKPSLHNNQLLTSSGIPSLDGVIGGGLAIGSVLLVEEDTYGSYSKTILKYFLAEGVMQQHELLLASASHPAQEIMQELPGPLLDDPGPAVKSGETNAGGDDMKIAWRYKNLPQVQSGTSGTAKFGHYFDMTKTMSEELLNKSPTTLMDMDKEEESVNSKFMNVKYLRLLEKIRDVIETGQYSTEVPGQQHKNILRIGVHSVGSPLWGEEGHIDEPSLCRFLFALRSLLRRAYAVCVLTMPTHLYTDVSLRQRIEHLCDTVIHLDSFAGSSKETNPAFKEYHGLFNLRKLPRLNSLTCHMPDTLDLAFKLRRKKFMIEMLHLPPELSDTASRGQEDALAPGPIQPSMGCSTGGTSKLDF